VSGAEVLLVTGSRALSDTARALRWTRAAILRAVADCMERTDRVRVVTGDADGADVEAEAIASGLNSGFGEVTYSLFRLDGVVIHEDRPNERWPGEEAPAHGSAERKRWPLKRNAAMVARVAKSPRVTVLALKAPWSKTDGTGHTVGLAARAGLTVVSLECPAELGPKGGAS